MSTNANDQDGEIYVGAKGGHTFDNAGEKEFMILNGLNLGNPTLLLSVPMQEFYDKSFVANSENIAAEVNLQNSREPVAQRSLDPRHALKLATYILKGLFPSLEAYYDQMYSKKPSSKFYQLWENLGRAPYQALQPIVVNIRACRPGGEDLKFKRYSDGKRTVFLTHAHKFWVIDGQHRREAMKYATQFLEEIQKTRTYPTTPALFTEGIHPGDPVSDEEYDVWGEILSYAMGSASVMVEAHLGLNTDQQRQLFHDLNNLAKKIDVNLAYDFDRANSINLYIKDKLMDGKILNANVVDKDISEKDWESHSGSFKRKDIIAICAILFLGKHNINSATPSTVANVENYADNFWRLVSGIPNFGSKGAKMKTVAAQPVVLKALARLFFEFNCGKGKGKKQNIPALNKLITALTRNEIDFSHKNQIWRYYQIDEATRSKQFPGLEDYLPDASRANPDIGTFNAARGDNGIMVFGSRHNDIYPILADMIRYMVGLPNRHKIKP